MLSDIGSSSSSSSSSSHNSRRAPRRRGPGASASVAGELARAPRPLTLMHAPHGLFFSCRESEPLCASCCARGRCCGGGSSSNNALIPLLRRVKRSRARSSSPSRATHRQHHICFHLMTTKYPQAHGPWQQCFSVASARALRSCTRSLDSASPLPPLLLLPSTRHPPRPPPSR